MFRKIEDFLNTYQHLQKDTLKLFQQLSDEILNQQVAAGHRTLGGIAWHIATAIPEMMKLTGLPLSAIDEKALPPASASEIRKAYPKASAELSEAVKNHWNDQDLLVEDEMYSEKWARGLTLTALIHHEIHHRGQMTVLLRQVGQEVPGLYGPAKEEWKEMGMEEPPY